MTLNSLWKFIRRASKGRTETIDLVDHMSALYRNSLVIAVNISLLLLVSRSARICIGTLYVLAFAQSKSSLSVLIARLSSESSQSQMDRNVDTQKAGYDRRILER